jgi:hypothetical protein
MVLPIFGRLILIQLCSSIEVYLNRYPHHQRTNALMQKLITTLLLWLILAAASGQTQRNVSLYMQGQYNKTLYDVTKGNNPWGMGPGLQLFFNNSARFKPTVDITADAYLEDDKVYRLYSDGTPINELGGMINVFAGATYHPTKRVNLSFVAGQAL